MNHNVRPGNFKLGCVHGKLDSERPEAQIQRILYIAPGLKINRTRKDSKIIRLIGYEIPIYHKHGVGRVECLDLIGYDVDHNFYIIELKTGESEESIYDVNNQINRYERRVKTILSKIEKEFEQTFFFQIKFHSIKKVILAPRKFYSKQKDIIRDESIEYGYYLLRDIKNAKRGEIIQIHLFTKN